MGEFWEGRIISCCLLFTSPGGSLQVGGLKWKDGVCVFEGGGFDYAEN